MDARKIKRRVLVQPYANVPRDSGDYIHMSRVLAALEDGEFEFDISTDPRADLTRYDLIHVFTLIEPRPALRYVINARRHNKPVLITPFYWRIPEAPLPASSDEARTELLQREFNREARRWMFKQARHIFSLSQMEGDLLVKDFDAPRERVRVAYQGIDPTFLSASEAAVTARDLPVPLIRLASKPFILCVGRIAPHKNQLGVIRAWHDETTPLVFIGSVADDEYLAQCRRAVNGEVYFLPPLAPNEINIVMRAAKVHVLASVFEEASLAALEAAVCGCGLVMSSNSSAREYFGDHVRLCDPQDENSIRDALKSALAEPREDTLARELQRRYSWTRTANVYAECYLTAMNAHESQDVSLEDERELGQLSSRLGRIITLKDRHYYSVVTPQLEAEKKWAGELEGQLVALERGKKWWRRPARRLSGMLDRKNNGAVK